MKIILDNSIEKTIGIDEITEEYLVVAIKESIEPCILSKGYHDNPRELCFFSFVNRFTTGNGYDFSEDENTIKKMIKEAIKQGYKIEAFHQDNWKEALQWLIDNAE